MDAIMASTSLERRENKYPIEVRKCMNIETEIEDDTVPYIPSCK